MWELVPRKNVCTREDFCSETFKSEVGGICVKGDRHHMANLQLHSHRWNS